MLIQYPVFSAIFPCPSNLKIIYGEQSLDLTWDVIPDAKGYNIYTASSPGLSMSKKRKINQTLITSGSHFTYIWDYEDGKRERKIKGRLHYLSVTAVYEKKGRVVESKPCPEMDDFYFNGFSNIDSIDKITRILKHVQISPPLPIEAHINKAQDFINFMVTKGRNLLDETKSKIDPLQVGACAPVSTILIKLLQEDGLYANRIEGNFINEYHTFVMINLDSVEYVVDFTADQFTPGVIPVIFPRDMSHLDANGKLSAEGRDIYLIGKIYSPEQSDLADNDIAQLYREIYNKVSDKKQ